MKDLKNPACLGLLLLAGGFHVRADWVARPIVVHEWGVSDFDWSRGRQQAPDFPDFFYRATRPGELIPAPDGRVKDMNADSGIRIRTKPVLYFYGPETLRGRPNSRSIPVAVEVRFRDGEALAWWPQVNRHREGSQTRETIVPNLETWDRMRMEKLRAHLETTLPSEEFRKVWGFYENRRFIPNGLGTPEILHKSPPFPDDVRFHLVWDRLELSQALNQTQNLRNDGLSDRHWVRLARQVDSDFVSNGTEVERFLFYEGQTPELPAIAIVPNDPFSPRSSRFLIYNISDHPVHDVIVAYRNRSEGRFWAAYYPRVNPIRSGGRILKDPDGPQSAPHVVLPTIPDFEDLRESDFVDEIAYHRRTQVQLSRALITDPPMAEGAYAGLRNPAQFQPPTEGHRLFPKEVVALQSIWNPSFFGQDGLTVVYRESPACLDEAMPLRVYTDMYHYVSLSRCGLVVNRGIDLAGLLTLHERLTTVLRSSQEDPAKQTRERKDGLWQCLRQNPLVTLTLLEYRLRSDSRPGDLPELIAELKSALARAWDESSDSTPPDRK